MKLNLIKGYRVNDIEFLEEVDNKNGIIYCKFHCYACDSDFIKIKSIISGKKPHKTCGCKLNKNIGKKNCRWKGCGDLSSTFYSNMKWHANKRNLEWNVSIEYLWELFEKQNRTCALSGQPIFFSETVTVKDKTNKTASLDRKDSTKGYIVGNVQWVDKDINYLKCNWLDHEFTRLCTMVHNHTFFNNKTILVWGAAGFIGSLLVKTLLEHGYKVLAVDNLYKSGKYLMQFYSNPNFEFKRLDIINENDVIKSLDNELYGIILLAGIVGLDACDQNQWLATATNDTGWSYIAKYWNKRVPLICASTGSVYGKIQGNTCTEDTATNPLSHYGITKYAGEQHIVNAGAKAFRFATAAGISPNMRLNLLPNELTFLALTRGELNIFEPQNMRTFIDTRDFVDSLIFGIENFDSLKYSIYNVGDDKNNWSKKQLAMYIKEKTGCHLSYNEVNKDRDARDYYCDYSRINSEGFKCKYYLSDTIDTLINALPLMDLNRDTMSENDYENRNVTIHPEVKQKLGLL